MKKLLVLILVLIPVLAFAGVDDTNFKCYTITPDKMLGTETNINLEDTPYAQEMTNIYNNGDSIVSFSHGATKNSMQHANTQFKGTDTDYYYMSMGVNPHPKPFYFDKTANSLTEISSFPFTDSIFGEFYFANGLYNGSQKTFIACNKGLTLHNYTNYKMYEVNLSPSWWPDGQPTSFTIWKKRLFVSGFYNDAYMNYVYYSKNGDFSNFTPTQYQGGIITIQPLCKIFKVAAVTDGVYIFTSDGIYYLSGGLPETWKLEKISNIVLNYNTSGAAYDPAGSSLCVIKNQILFISQKREIYIISGYQVNKIADFPIKNNVVINVSGISLLKDRYVLITDFYSTDCMVYDVKAKCWYVWSNIVNVSDNGYTAISTIDYVNGNFYFCNDDFNTWYKTDSGKYKNKILTINSAYPDIKYEMPWYSLDGNSANYKKIKRVEIDAKGYASSNSIKLKIKTNKNSSWQEINKSVTDNIADPNVYFDDNSQTYTFRFIGTNEFQKIKLRLETKYSLILNQIRIYYEPVGVK